MEKNATVVLKTHNRIDKSDYVKGKISYSELNPKYFKAWEWAGQRDREIERGGGGVSAINIIISDLKSYVRVFVLTVGIS